MSPFTTFASRHGTILTFFVLACATPTNVRHIWVLTEALVQAYFNLVVKLTKRRWSHPASC